MIIKTRSYPRAALIGNPSDGYFGKTIAFVFDNFSAEITLYESPRLEIVPNVLDLSRFTSVTHLFQSVKKYGYYGGIRLIKAAIKRFYDYCLEQHYPLDGRNFTIEYRSNIPHSLGLAGSSAIITACMKALMQFYQIEIPKPQLANLVLSVETQELDIPAGLQDRVAQAYEKPVYMNFDKKIMETQGFGQYAELAPELFPPMYIAYHNNLSEGSEIPHNNLRARYQMKDQKVLDAIAEWAELSLKVKQHLESGKGAKIGQFLNRNFDLRRSVMQLSKGNTDMVELARSVGASAKFTGSGGAIIGTYENESMFEVLKIRMKAQNIRVIKPKIVCP